LRGPASSATIANPGELASRLAETEFDVIDENGAPAGEKFLLRKGADTPVHELLSGREFQVLRMIASGKTVKQIADEIALSVKTVSTYRARILEKTGMKTTAELIRFALQSHLVD
jgi:two-component system invasion response regulator UvrY